jgi:hypothetical protein
MAAKVACCLDRPYEDAVTARRKGMAARRTPGHSFLAI